jgi:hypothetical protein
VHRLGGGIGMITLLQVMSGCFGIYLLSREIMRSWSASPRAIRWYPFFLLVFLLTPFTPLPFYLMGFIKDSWLGIELIWVAYLALRAKQIQKRESAAYRMNYFLLLAGMNFVLLTRHNAVVLLPIFFLILYHIINRLRLPGESKLSIIFWSSIPLFLFLFSEHQIYFSFKVAHSYPENQVYVLETVGVVVENTDNGKYVPYVKSHLSPNYKEAYLPGNVTPVMFWTNSRALDTLFNRDNPLVKEQYYELVKKVPFTVLKVKWDGFVQMLLPQRDRYLYHGQLDDNNFGLKQNLRFAKTRALWQRMTDAIHNNRLTDLIADEHVVWLLINIALLIGFMKKGLLDSLLFVLLLLPLGYYLSYMLAATASDYRMMFPATVLMQVLGLSLGLVRLDNYLNSR